MSFWPVPCSACTFAENSVRLTHCDMCGTAYSAPVEDLPPPYDPNIGIPVASLYQQGVYEQIPNEVVYPNRNEQVNYQQPVFVPQIQPVNNGIQNQMFNGVPVVYQDMTKWACKACTFENEAGSEVCEMCNSKK